MGTVQIAYMNMGFFFYIKGKCGTHGPHMCHRSSWSCWVISQARDEGKDIPQVGVVSTSEASIPEGYM